MFVAAMTFSTRSESNADNRKHDFDFYIKKNKLFNLRWMISFKEGFLGVYCNSNFLYKAKRSNLVYRIFVDFGTLPTFKRERTFYD